MLQLLRSLLLMLRLLWRTIRVQCYRFSKFIAVALIRILHAPRPVAGFVLPVSILVGLVVVIFMGSILFRSTVEVENRVLDTAALVNKSLSRGAVERAKAKLEFLFRADNRFTNGIPSERYLYAMMQNADGNNDSDVDFDIDGDGMADDLGILRVGDRDPYTLPDETRLDLDNDATTVENAWSYREDINGDGNLRTVAYSISFLTTDGTNTITNANDAVKAEAGIARTGPISADASSANSCTIPGLQPGAGWYGVGAATARKNFQINVFTEDDLPLSSPAKTAEAVEFQQDRELNLGNRFGVWFRYDLLIHPGPTFNLNGSIHTDGSLLTWRPNKNFLLVSSPDSCIYDELSNIISMSEDRNIAGVLLYQGQLINLDDGNSATQNVDIFPPGGGAPSGAYLNSTLSQDTDSITENFTISNGGIPSGANKYLLDPIRLFTEDKLRSRGLNTGATTTDDDGTTAQIYDNSNRDTNFGTDPNTEVSDRVFNDTEQAPFVDDTYRADDRWGPQPSYGRNAFARIPYDSSTDTNAYGEIIQDGDNPGLNALELTNLNPPPEFPEEVGLDGYWERRAYNEGARLIVGQRLELGNAHGWLLDANGDGDFDDALDRDHGDDPINPADPAFVTPTGDSDTKANIYRAQRTLRDNLAAVQAGIFYHAAVDRDFPTACIALTAHPGTLISKTNSTTFAALPSGNPKVDFLAGNGTNGWEFDRPGGAADANAFANLLDANDPLRIALENLANFAGDPEGAFPPVQEAFGGIVHPYPQLTMWGDFSNLRRALDELDSTAFTNLSIADRATIETSACLLGMLAYNLDTLQDEFNASLASGSNLQSLGVDLSKLFAQGSGNSCNGANPSAIDASLYSGGSSGSGCLFGPNGTAIDSDSWTDPNPNSVIPGSCDGVANGGLTDGPGFTPFCDEPEVFAEFTVEQLLDQAGITGSDRDDLLSAAIVFEEISQIERDRLNGFQAGLAELPVPNGATAVGWDRTTGYTSPTQVQANENIVIQSTCDPDIFDNVVGGSSGGSSGSSARSRMGLALVLCRSGNVGMPKYPSLFYIFPKASHDHVGTLTATATTNGGTQTIQPVREPYISDTQIFNATTGADDAINDGVVYRVVDGSITDIAQLASNADVGIDAIALSPRLPANWSLPHRTSETGTAGQYTAEAKKAALNKIAFNGTDYYVPFLDKGMFDGRQLQLARVLNLDLDLLRGDSTPATTNLNTPAGESWMPNSGIVYAFREDAVREDGIARPTANNTTYANCNTETNLLTADSCRMVPMGATLQDPPVNNETGVSLKPVDFEADPDRRVHGFRLANGLDLRRAGTTDGLSFITDQPAYIFGDFNLHSNEEFTQTLDDDYGNFYTRSTLDTDFATANALDATAGDRWRPTEILSDATSILSNSYCDGTVDAGLRDRTNTAIAGEACSNHSFLNSTIIASSTRPFVLEDGTLAPTNGTDPAPIPILVSRNGEIEYDDGGTLTSIGEASGTMRSPVDRDGRESSLNNASETRIDAIIVSGIGPTRVNESYGGLHNFPRFLEDWDDIAARLRGSLIQLNFSTYGTAGRDQADTFQFPNPLPSSTAGSGGGTFAFYDPPDRLWGYDPALQYTPPTPIAARLLTSASPRSEVFQRIDIFDPYAQILCNAINGKSCP